MCLVQHHCHRSQDEGSVDLYPCERREDHGSLIAFIVTENQISQCTLIVIN